MSWNARIAPSSGQTPPPSGKTPSPSGKTQTTPGGEWTITGATTKVRFSFQAVPGNYIGFRVIAARDDEQSAPSVPVVLWLNGNENVSLSLAA